MCNDAHHQNRVIQTAGLEGDTTVSTYTPQQSAPGAHANPNDQSPPAVESNNLRPHDYRKAAMSNPATAPKAPTSAEFLAMSDSPEYLELKKTFRGFAFPMSVLFLAWYLIYITIATFAVDLVSTPVYDKINLGMVLGLAQFATTGIFTWAYVKFMGNKVDPLSEKIREQMTAPKGGAQ